jgi:hypothetical protein
MRDEERFKVIISIFCVPVLYFITTVFGTQVAQIAGLATMALRWDSVTLDV